ncbi:hypothetical protein [Mogibacterium timidum]
MDDSIVKSINTSMQPYGIRPNIQFVNNFESMVNCVRYNLGVAICDEYTGYLKDADIGALDLIEAEYVSVAIINSSTNDEVRELYQIIKDAVQGL